MIRKTLVTSLLAVALAFVGCTDGTATSDNGGSSGSGSGGPDSGPTDTGATNGSGTSGDASRSDANPTDGEGGEDNKWSDEDEDGRLDEFDNCPETKNTDQKDTDGDGVGDKCDNCKEIPNKDQADMDDDGTGDACSGLADPQGDADQDGVPNGEDNCPEVGNQDQKDADNDGIGDKCDNCKQVANTEQKDSDGDGTGDRCEEENSAEFGGSGTDSDGDGISDEDEMEIGTDPNNPDSDGDGKQDGTEVVVGSDPTTSDQACGEETKEAEQVRKPIDIVFAIDVSGSMDEEIAAVEQNINTNFANIIQSSGVDYRVIILAAKDEVCIESPLGGNNCSSGQQTQDTMRLKHLNTCDGTCSEQTMMTFLDYFDQQSPNYKQYLRQNSFKVLVAISDENEQADWGSGQGAAQEFDQRLLMKSQTHFGTMSNRNYLYHSIVGLAEKSSDPNKAYQPSEPIVNSACPTAWTSSDYAPTSQWASKITGGLRYPVCRTDNYDAVFQEIADGVVRLSRISCTLSFPSVPSDKYVDKDGIILEWTPQGGSTQYLTQVSDQSQCGPDNFYVANGNIQLCDPEPCDTISNSSDGKLEIYTGCNNCPDPSPEVCGDGKDNDCDGETDEGCKELCEPEREVCDGKDNDCDGETDEGCPQCTLDGESCQTDAECCNDNCNADGVCGADCRPIGVSCISGSQCCSEICSSSGGGVGQCQGG